MHDEVLVSFGSLDLQASLPGITANVAELSRNLKDFQVVHECESDLRLLSGFHEDRLRPIVVQVLEGLFVFHACEGTLRPNVLRH